MNHAPIIPKIMKLERNPKDNSRLVTACSETESVRGSCVNNKGFTAFWYLKLGKKIRPEEAIPNPEIIIDIRNPKQLRNFLDSLLNFFIISETTTKTVDNNIAIPI